MNYRAFLRAICVFVPALLSAFPLPATAQPHANPRVRIAFVKASGQHGTRNVTGPSARDTNNYTVQFGVKTFLMGWTEYNIDTCESVSSGNWSYDTMPAHGTPSTEIEYDYLSNGDCPGVKFPFNEIFYTWDKDENTATTDTFNATWSTPDGEFSDPETFDFDLGSKLKITSPMDKDSFALDQNNFTETAKIPFSAQSDDKQTQLGWNITLSYKTSRGNCVYNGDPRTPTSPPDKTVNEVYRAMGGKLAVKVSQGSSTDSVEAFITGSSIPKDSVTNQLVSLYPNGATPRLLTGIAMEESSYQQFTNTKVDGVTVLWPTAAGCHIGLMGYGPPSVFDEIIAWSWIENTKAGATIFKGDLPISDANEKIFRKHNPQLPKLTLTQREDNALCYYKNGTAPAKSYWLPSNDGKSWIKSSGCLNDGNKNYADVARADIQ